MGKSNPLWTVEGVPAPIAIARLMQGPAGQGDVPSRSWTQYSSDMADFIGEDLSGSRFERVNLAGSRFERIILSGAEIRASDIVDTRFRGVEMSGVVMRGVALADVDIYGEIGSLTINGVDVGPLVNAELDRRYPERAKMRPTDPAGFREAWDVVEQLWGDTVERARRVDPELLHESVGGEWSFIETLRHLAFATDSWIRRAILGDPLQMDLLGRLERP